MNYDVKFPDMENYDMGDPGERALYHAHSDLMPFKSVIDITKTSVMAFSEFYHNQSKAARDHGDSVTEGWAMTSGMLYSARAIPLTYYSLVLIMVSLLEEAFNTLCRIQHLEKNSQLNKKILLDKGLNGRLHILKK